MKILFFLFTIITIIFEITGQYLFKISYKKTEVKNPINSFFDYIITNYLKNNKNLIVFLGIICYCFTGFFVYKLLNFGHLGVINVIWHLIHFIALFLVGYFLLGEKLTTKKIIASIIGMISILIFMTDHEH